MASTTSSARTDRRARRRILGCGALALAVIGTAGAFEGIPRAERDLERRVGERLEADGITGVHVSFSGQDGTLHCEAPLADPARAERLAEQPWGVRVAHIDRSCRADATSNGAASPADGAATTDPAADTTIAAAPTTSDASTTTAAPTTAAPTTVAPATTTAPRAEAGDVVATLADGRIVFTGSVADEAARRTLLDAVAGAVDPANVDDRLTIADADVLGATAADLVGLVDLVAVMPSNLVSGTATRDGDGGLRIDGVVVDASGSDAVQDAVRATGAEATLTERQDATALQATQLTDELNAFVAANPILFDPGRATLTDGATAVVEQVAAIANRYAGVRIRIVGHTDSDGDVARNFELSAQRAATVRDALVDRGVTAPIEIVGAGESDPVLVNGVEDKVASRRVVFEITAA